MAIDTIKSTAVLDGAISTADLANDIAINTSGAITTTGAFTSKGIDDNADATALTITSDEEVLIGKTTDAQQTAGTALYPSGQIYNTASGTHPLVVTRKTNDGAIALFYKDTNEVGRIGTVGNQSYIHGAGTDVGIYFGSNNLYPYRSTGLNDATIDLGQSAKRFKDAYLSGGIYLGGTGADNHLDDYEEGTWSPFWCNNAGQAVFSVNPNVNMARYIKIGRQVTASCYFNMPGTFSPSGNFVASAGLQIGGLPFTANSNGTNDYYSGTVGWYANFASSYNNVSSKTPIIYTKTNSNQIELGHANGIGHASTLQEHAYNSNSGILLTISYLTTS
jgi:hypothetical protein